MTYLKGVTPTVGRAMVVNCTQLATYSQAKFYYKKYLGFKEGTLLHFASSLTAGFIYSLASLPLDNAKTRMQKSGKGSEYTGMFKTMYIIARREGFIRLWNGFTMYFMRCGGHTITMFIAMEQYRNLYRKYIA
jgi:solute carrier family 25 (mitochondrial oxoglutarate transporter), member 11